MLLENKKGLIIGLANSNSIAYGIAKVLRENGASLALTYQNDALKKRVLPIAQELGAEIVQHCDVINQDSIDNLFAEIKAKWGSFDFLVHAVAYSDRSELQGRFIDTSLDNFLQTMHISCYSLVSLAKKAEELLSEGGSILTLSYYGAQKVVPNYNVMGVAKAALESSVRYLSSDLGPKIRINAISAGPIKTLAASAIGGIRTMLKVHESTSPLQRNISTIDVAKSSLYLLSNLASGVTGEVHYVDCGYNVMGFSVSQEQV
jgi:enoyl-[acyl-carrier protein] reductase I